MGLVVDAQNTLVIIVAFLIFVLINTFLKNINGEYFNISIFSFITYLLLIQDRDLIFFNTSIPSIRWLVIRANQNASIKF